MLSDATLAYAEELTTALLGVDALYRAESGDGDGLVVLNMSTTHQPIAFASYDDAQACFAELERRAAGLPEPDRRLYYAQACRSTLAVISWRRGDLPFTGQIADFLHVPAAPAGDDELDALRSEMRTLLGRMDYSGDLAAQCAAWEARNRVPADQVQGVLDTLLDEAWDRTVERMQIPAPRTDGMRVTTVSGAPFNARCNYLARQVELNIDPILTRPAPTTLAEPHSQPDPLP